MSCECGWTSAGKGAVGLEWVDMRVRCLCKALVACFWAGNRVLENLVNAAVETEGA